MNRRNLLKQLAFSTGGALALPAWARSWTPDSLPRSVCSFSSSEEALLAEFVESLIPATDTPGAKELGVHKFVLTMLSDCFEKNIRDEFSKGLLHLNEGSKAKFNKSFLDINSSQRNEVLSMLETEKKSGTGESNLFYSTVKGLTIQGYLNSEYVMTNLLKYELIPSRFDGCFPVKK